tara:strand:- start:22 stop:693 length:672 start_codon:yes stop_codon:yes gene_type:complete
MKFILLWFLAILPSLVYGKISFENKEIEITAAADQEKVTFVFPFKNEGSTPVTIIDVNLTCSCLSAKTDKEIYSSGEKGQLKAIFAIGSFTGIQRKSMTMISQQEGKEKTRDALLAILTIPDVITIEPELIKWKVNEDPSEKVFYMKVPHADPIKIQNVTCSRDGFKFSWKELKVGREYEIRVKPLSTASPMLGMIKIDTDSKIKKHQRKLAFFSIARSRSRR